MSTDYLPRAPILFGQVKGISIEGVHEHQAEDTTLDNACLTDGKNYLWAVKTSTNFTWFSRYGRNSVDDILDALAEHFNTEFISEHDDDWGEVLNQCAEGLDYISIQLPQTCQDLEARKNARLHKIERGRR